MWWFTIFKMMIYKKKNQTTEYLPASEKSSESISRKLNFAQNADTTFLHSHDEISYEDMLTSLFLRDSQKQWHFDHFASQNRPPNIEALHVTYHRVNMADCPNPFKTTGVQPIITVCSTYCKIGNFRATLIFVLFAHFWASAKLKTCESVYFVYRSM